MGVKQVFHGRETGVSWACNKCFMGMKHWLSLRTDCKCRQYYSTFHFMNHFSLKEMPMFRRM